MSRAAVSEAVSKDNLETFMQLVPSKVKVDARVDKKGIIFSAIEANALNCLQYLLDQGVDLGQCDPSGVYFKFIKRRFTLQLCRIKGSLRL